MNIPTSDLKSLIVDYVTAVADNKKEYDDLLESLLPPATMFNLETRRSLFGGSIHPGLY